ncbi:MAG: hypothetical protein ABFD92_10790 [Planctomycetaceae bacterium]
MSAAIVPSSKQKMVTPEGTVTPEYQRFFNAIAGSATPFASVTRTSSPMSYTASGSGHLNINGGSISGLSLRRAGSTITLSATTLMIPMSNGDLVTITYTGSPTLTFIPA